METVVEVRSMRARLVGVLGALTTVFAMLLVGPTPPAAAAECTWGASYSIKLCGSMATERDGAHLKTKKVRWKATVHDRTVQVAGITIVNAAMSNCYDRDPMCSEFRVKQSRFKSGLGPHVVRPSYRNKWGQITGWNYSGTTATVKWRHGQGKWRTFKAVINQGSVGWW